MAAVVFVLAAALAGCGDDDESGSSGTPDAASGSDTVDGGAEENSSGDAGDGEPDPGQDDPPAPTGEARATIEMGGEVHHLTLNPELTQSSRIECTINPETQDAVVGGMVSADGIQLEMLTTFGNWGAIVFGPDGENWRAGGADTHPGTDYTFEVAEGRLVIDGIWGAPDGEGTEEIRVELICP